MKVLGGIVEVEVPLFLVGFESFEVAKGCWVVLWVVKRFFWVVADVVSFAPLWWRRSLHLNRIGDTRALVYELDLVVSGDLLGISKLIYVFLNDL